MSQTLIAARLHTPSHVWINPVITLNDDGLITSIETASSSSDDTILTPTFLDIHIHGAVNHDVMEGTPEALNSISRFLATRGVSHYLPTTVTAAVDPTLRALDSIATNIETKHHDGAIPLGIHLEGPFVSHIKRGVHPPEHILPPSIELFDRFQQAARGHIRLITIAPETPGALELIHHATKLGVKVSIGHSNATAAETHAALAAGATSATHTFNAMRALDHREPGILGVVLDDRNLFAELICDGVHVAPELVRLFLKAKGTEKAILITDGMSATGMPDGTYILGGFEVQVANGRCLANGVLAGSVLTLDRAVFNFARFTGTPFADVTHLASRNPAAMLGLEAQLTIAPGQPANFNRYTPDGTLLATILNGRQVI
ncbi:N-acetylglucosamine-6-phosphate deacetylase [Granulicella arctica]|uniref:N-acetylglucosamine-6-phosphate deacetylase n=1 Tax=Granulicella arctica TaxID=940613 RepID=A0A7Y9PIK7_9BACT|nr:N-acetylglucosamine-6-phosphate deacetylase [Granulicella arctica]NYF80521.1 N-acetylglucosamine-6-phosphate deacetylase [Granulicella arctica]